MAHKIAIALTLLALIGCASAATVAYTGTAASFAFQPTTSFSQAATSDSLLLGHTSWARYASSATDGVAWLYQLGQASDSTTTSTQTAFFQPGNAASCATTACITYKLYSRKLYAANYTTYGPNTGVPAYTTSDVAQATTFTWTAPQAMTTTIDQVAWATAWTNTVTGTDVNVYVQICVATSAGAPVCKSKTTGATTATTIHSLYCDSVSKNCYVLFGSTTAAAVVYQVYGVTSTGTEVWTAGFVAVGTQGAATATAGGVVYGNSTNTTLNDIVNVAYIDGAVNCANTGVCTVKYTSVATAAATTATVPATPSTAATNVATAVYTPCGGVVTNTTNALLLCFQNAATVATSTVFNVTAIFTPSKATTLTMQYLNGTVVNKAFVSAWGTYYGAGFFVVSQAGSSSSYATYYNTYNATGFNLTNGGVTLGTYTDTKDMGNWFVTANSTLGYGYISYDDGTGTAYSPTAAATVATGRTATAMAGSIAHSIYNGASSGNVLASFVAFIAMMIAALFAF